MRNYPTTELANRGLKKREGVRHLRL